MKKILISTYFLPLFLVLFSFTPKSIITKLIVFEVFNYNNTNAQSYLTKSQADSLYKPITYIPTIQVFGFNLAFDSSGIFYAAPIPDYNINIYNLPEISNVGHSGNYNDLSFLPQIPNPGYGINTYGNEWAVDSAYYPTIRVFNNAITSLSTSIATPSLSIVGQILSIENNTTAVINSVIIPTVTSSQISIALGGSPILAETQSLSISGKTISIKSGATTTGSVQIPNVTSSDITSALGAPALTVEIDGSITNEIQTPNYVSGILGLSGTSTTVNISPTSGQVISALGYIPMNNTVSIPAVQVNSDWNSSSGISQVLNKPTLGTASGQNSTAFATAAQGILASTALQAEVDGSTTNELQTLSGSNTNTLMLSNGGGTFLIPVYTYVTNTTTRTVVIGTAYQPSTTKDVDVRTNPQIICILNLSGGQTGNIDLQISANGTSGWITRRSLTNSNTGSLTIGLNTSQTNASELSTIVPATWYYRLNSGGTGTFNSINPAEEITH